MTKCFGLLLTVLSLMPILSAQTVLFSENFDGASVSFVASSSGTSPTWAINNALSVSGSKSDSAVVQSGDSLFLESSSFNTTGYSNVAINFTHICKIDFFDKAILEYSINNGSSWIQLTSNEYSGNAFLIQNSFSAVSYSAWQIANASAVPTSSWWISESFDISAAAGLSNVKLRFVLIDGDNNGAVNNYGWLLEDVSVIGSPCELIPPIIQYAGNVYQGQTFGNGPFLIEADIQDLSGVKSAHLSYQLNGGAWDTLTMVANSASNYQATIPTATIGDTICYYFYAFDGTTCSNKGSFPQSCTQFYLEANPPPRCVGRPVNSFNYLESFASFTPGNGSSTPGVLRNGWVNETSDSHNWWVFDRATNSNQTGPTSDHSGGDANYLYVEATGYQNRTAILNTPCYDFSNSTKPKFSFWYHMYGSYMGSLHVDAYFGGQWVLDIMPVISGDQGNSWKQREIDLSAFAGNVIKLRFRAITLNDFHSDIAIDDIEIIEPNVNDIEITSLVSPSNQGCHGVLNEFVTVQILNNGTSSQDTIPLAYRINNGSIIIDTSFVNVGPNATINHTFQQSFNMSVPGVYKIDAWLALSTDAKTTNDSLLNQNRSTSLFSYNYPDTSNFDNFVTGVPGTLYDGWKNSSSDSHDWYVHTAGTPSSATGPSSDTTSGNGNYLYMEATGVIQGVQAILESKCYNISNLNQPELSFYYHMYGLNMGELHIDLLINGFLIQDIIQPINGDQGNLWKLQTVDLSQYKGIVKVLFRSIRGSGISSDIAIDDVVIKDNSPVNLSEITVNQGSIRIFPNPTSDFLQFESVLKDGFDLWVYDSFGKLILQDKFSGHRNAVDLTSFSSGVYLIKIRTANGIQTNKIIKQ